MNPQVGNTFIVNGYEYTYTLICGKEEHTHTDSCYSDKTETDGGNQGILLTALEDESESTSSLASESESASEEETAEAAAATESTGSTESTEETGSTEESGSLTVDTTTGESVTYTAADCVYDSDTGDFSVNVALDFTFLKDNKSSSYYKSTYDTSIVKTDGYTVAYKIALPEGVVVPSSMLGIAYNGYDQSSTKRFEYYFVEDTDESGEGDGTYSVVLVFADSFIDSLTGNTFTVH